MRDNQKSSSVVDMATGYVRFFSDREAYGFIKRDGYGQDIFVQRSDVEAGDLSEGVRVEFDISSAGRGPRARRVRTTVDD